MLRYHCVKVEELIRKSFLIIPQSLISSKLNSSIFLRSSFLGLSSLLLREKRADGNTVGYIHSRRTFLLDLFMALWDLRAPFFQACNGTWRIFVHSTLHLTSLVRPRFSFPSFWVLLHIWENNFVVIAWEQANLSLILNLYCTRLKSGKILREFSNIACSKNLELHLLTNDYLFLTG